MAVPPWMHQISSEMTGRWSATITFTRNTKSNGYLIQRERTKKYRFTLLIAYQMAIFKASNLLAQENNLESLR